MDIKTLEIVKAANKIVKDCDTRSLYRLAKELGIEVVPLNFTKQRGVI